jgi:hypothetical protein
MHGKLPVQHCAAQRRVRIAPGEGENQMTIAGKQILIPFLDVQMLHAVIEPTLAMAEDAATSVVFLRVWAEAHLVDHEVLYSELRGLQSQVEGARAHFEIEPIESAESLAHYARERQADLIILPNPDTLSDAQARWVRAIEAHAPCRVLILTASAA